MVDYIIAAILLILFVIAVRSAFFNKDGACSGCAGCPAAKNCASLKKNK